MWFEHFNFFLTLHFSDMTHKVMQVNINNINGIVTYPLFNLVNFLYYLTIPLLKLSAKIKKQTHIQYYWFIVIQCILTINS